MSSNRRPWYPWYPKDFVVDEKVQALSPIAELIYRRALDVMWQANGRQLPKHLPKLCQALAKGLSKQEFENAWQEIQFDGFELFKTSDCGRWIYSSRLKSEYEKICNISKTRSKLGKKGAQAKAKAIAEAKASRLLKQNVSHTDTHTDTDINKKEKIIKKKNASQIPPDLTLNDKMVAYAKSKGINGNRVESIFEHFVNHHTAKGSKFKCWEAAWRTWCINDSNFNKSQTGLTDKERAERERIDRKYSKQA